MSLFGNAGINVADVADDPYVFGNSHWRIFVKEVREPKASEKTGRYGSYVIFEIAEDRYANVRPFGRWIELPPPMDIQEAYGYRFDPETNFEHARAVNNLVKFLTALGYGMDEIQGLEDFTSIAAEDNPRRFFMAKLKAKENEESGFDEISWYQPKKYDSASEDGHEEFSPTNKAAEALAREAAGE